MTDPDTEFDKFLAEALAPPRRAPDQQFVERVRQQVLLDELLRQRRARAVERLGVEMLSLVAIGCGLAALGSSSEIAESIRQAPHLALAGAMLVFGLWVPLIAGPKRGGFSAI